MKGPTVPFGPQLPTALDATHLLFLDFCAGEEEKTG